QSLQVISFQPYKQGRLAVSEGIDPSSYYGMTRPIGEMDSPTMPFLHYRWRDTYPSLQKLSRGSGNPYDGVALEYVNPVTGGSTFPTLGLWNQILPPGEPNQTPPPPQHEHLSCLPRQRHNSDQRRAVSLGERRHFHRAALVMARAPQPLC